MSICLEKLVIIFLNVDLGLKFKHNYKKIRGKIHVIISLTLNAITLQLLKFYFNITIYLCISHYTNKYRVSNVIITSNFFFFNL